MNRSACRALASMSTFSAEALATSQVQTVSNSAMLGGGREKKEDTIDHGVGLEFRKRIGDRVEKGEPLATIHYNSSTKLAEAKNLIAASYFIGAQARSEQRPLVRRILGA